MHSSDTSAFPSIRFASGDWRETREPSRIEERGDDAACFVLYREMLDLPVIAKFTVNGEPASKARPRFTKKGSKTFAYTPERTREAEEAVEKAFRDVTEGYQPDPEASFGVIALFFCRALTRRDTDNMLKLVLDGLNRVAWPDDNQVVEVSARKSLVPGNEARTEIVVYRVGWMQKFTEFCLTCSKEFVTHGRTATNRGGKRKYCSPECYQARRRDNAPTRACASCGTEFIRSHRQKSKYCSNECGRKFMGGRKAGAV
jgi:crossover junction endodeoxyribonuclease RusA